MAEECLPCVKAARERMARMSLMTGSCAMLSNPDDREKCQQAVNGYSDEDLSDLGKLAPFFADLIEKGDVALFKQYFEMLNESQAKCFMMGVDHLRQQGKQVPYTVATTYDWYKKQIESSDNRAEEIKI